MSRATLAAALVSATVSILGAGCTTGQRVGVETALAQAFISDEQESKIGLQLKGELEKKPEFRYVEDAQITQYVAGVADKVIVHAKRDRPGVEWRVAVIDDPKTVNAFATPGGFLYVYSGLVLAADNEAELAGVMAHEAGHVVGRHSARQMVQSNGLDAIARLALGQNPNLLGQLAANVAGKGVLLAHGRSQETEADEYGARYSSAAGYDPKGLATFFQKLQAKEGKVPSVLSWLSSHPATGERITYVNGYIAQNKLGGTDVGADRIIPIKQRLQAYKAPARPATGGFPSNSSGFPPTDSPSTGTPAGTQTQPKPAGGFPPN